MSAGTPFAMKYKHRARPCSTSARSHRRRRAAAFGSRRSGELKSVQRLPAAVEVERHQVDPVDRLRDLRSSQLPARVDVAAGDVVRQEVVRPFVCCRARRAAPELLEEQRRVRAVGRRVMRAVAGILARVLPVDVDAVEEAGRRARAAGAFGQPPPGRLPLMKRSMHDATNAGASRRSRRRRRSTSSRSSRRSRSRAGGRVRGLQLASWLKLPKRCWFRFGGSSATPSTLSAPSTSEPGSRTRRRSAHSRSASRTRRRSR